MLVKLLDYEIPRHWEVIKTSLMTVLEGDIDYSLILAKLIQDEIQAWFIEEDKKHVGVIVTCQAIEPITNVKNLIIICAKSLEVIKYETWKRTINSLVKWSQSYGMKNIVSYSNNPRIIQVLNKYGANTDTRLIKIEV